jgi:hypothetical protein
MQRALGVSIWLRSRSSAERFLNSWMRIPLDPITCSGRTRSLVPEDPIRRSERSDEGAGVQWL